MPPKTTTFKKPTTQAVQPIKPQPVPDNAAPKQRVITEEAIAWASQPDGVAPVKKRSQPKRKTPPKVLRSFRLPQELLGRIEVVSQDVGLPDYSVVELLLNEALKARGLPKGAISQSSAD